QRQRQIDPPSLCNRFGEHACRAKCGGGHAFRPGSDRDGKDFMARSPLEPGEVRRHTLLPPPPERGKDVRDDHGGHRPSPRTMTHGVLSMIMSSVAMNA